jgi:alkylation response protein AidB-like acyl-CoA dehydrogenase
LIPPLPFDTPPALPLPWGSFPQPETAPMFIRAQHDDSALAGFRQEVAAFCKTDLPADIIRKVNIGEHLEKEDYGRWMQALAKMGWLTGKWPKVHGGQGWGPAHRVIFDEETGKAGAPWIMPFGVTMVGPVIYTFGSPEQKARYLPGIVSAETWWCQGYSEPGAGSDLAGLKTRAIKDGDTYVVNGQKIWTSYAHWADMIFCLVRTRDGAKSQDGISFLLIDMKTPGITVRPIISLDLGHSLNEVFFDNVRVPVANLIGEENKGWTYAKYLLAHERTGSAEIGKFKRYLIQLRHLLDKTYESGKPLSLDMNFRRKVADLELRLTTLEALLADQLAAVEAGAPALVGASSLKLRGSELQQAILQTMMEVLGRHGLAYQTDALVAGWNGDLVGPEGAAGMVNDHLYRRAATIYAGSSEIQHNIIARDLLQ